MNGLEQDDKGGGRGRNGNMKNRRREGTHLVVWWLLRSTDNGLAVAGINAFAFASSTALARDP